jgi:hypothetical protein
MELLHEESGRVLEAVHYQVDPANRAAFLTAMREVYRAVQFQATGRSKIRPLRYPSADAVGP